MNSKLVWQKAHNNSTDIFFASWVMGELQVLLCCCCELKVETENEIGGAKVEAQEEKGLGLQLFSAL